MASLLSSHLDQINLCSNSIAQLSFPGPRIFTNALLSNHDITSLIRDTEQHERALFHLAPPPLPPKSAGGAADLTSSVGSALPTTTPAKRRATAYGGARQPKNKAVAAVLGGDLYQKTRRPGTQTSKGAGEIDVEVLLHGAEKLAAVYPLPAASEKITSLRRRHQQLEANIQHYEGRVAEQTRELQAMNRSNSRSGYSDAGDEEEGAGRAGAVGGGVGGDGVAMTREDLAREEEEIKELERKKKGLEERVEGMGRDLSGLGR